MKDSWSKLRYVQRVLEADIAPCEADRKAALIMVKEIRDEIWDELMAREKLLIALKDARASLDELAKLGNGDTDGNSFGNSIAQEARRKIDLTLADYE